eukprot:2208900-Lingulodinium_polyedra.AAC.1
MLAPAGIGATAVRVCSCCAHQGGEDASGPGSFLSSVSVRWIHLRSYVGGRRWFAGCRPDIKFSSAGCAR